MKSLSLSALYPTYTAANQCKSRPVWDGIISKTATPFTDLRSATPLRDGLTACLPGFFFKLSYALHLYFSPVKSLGNASSVMYTTNVHPGHNSVNYPPTIVTNGQSHPQRSAPTTNPTKDPINVIGVPSVHISNNQLVVGSSQSSLYSFLVPVIFPNLSDLFLLQAPHDPIRLSRSSATVHLELSGCVIGMGPYPPIPRCHPCNVGPVRGQNGLENAS